MIRLLVAAGATGGGWAAVCLALRASHRRLGSARYRRTNHRGLAIPGASGVTLVAAVAFGAVVAAAAAWADLGGAWPGVASAGAGCAMAVLGFVDDRSSSAAGGGFRAHLAAALRGRFTTGLGKAVGGAVVGVVVAATVGHRGPWILVGGAVVAMSANVVNLFDLRPGRAAKVWVLGAGGALVAAPPYSASIVLLATAGGLVAFVPGDLRERRMLGDGGANLLGSVLGATLVASLGRGGLVVTAVVLAVATIASEFVSFGRVIDRIAPLRAIDGLGRGPQPPAAT